MNYFKLIESVKSNEGFSSGIYKCIAGKRTIGYGRNLDDVGITGREASYLLETDLKRCQIQLQENIDLFDRLPDYVQNVLIEMCYQLGIGGLMTFKNTIKHIKWGQYEEASKEMLNSKWANQTPNRALYLSKIMFGGFNNV
jgi:lysozyme